MAIFDCSRCGKCCRSFGGMIRIERQVSGQDYFCRYGGTGEIFRVHVQPEYADEIEETCGEDGMGRPSGGACPFLCKSRSGEGFSCAIYPTRPGICSGFRCYRMLIYDAAGNELRGKVIGDGDLSTADETLKMIWNNEIRQIIPEHGRAGDPRWLEKVRSVLATHGYRGDPVE